MTQSRPRRVAMFFAMLDQRIILPITLFLKIVFFIASLSPSKKPDRHLHVYFFNWITQMRSALRSGRSSSSRLPDVIVGHWFWIVILSWNLKNVHIFRILTSMKLAIPRLIHQLHPQRPRPYLLLQLQRSLERVRWRMEIGLFSQIMAPCVWHKFIFSRPYDWRCLSRWIRSTQAPSLLRDAWCLQWRPVEHGDGDLENRCDLLGKSQKISVQVLASGCTITVTDSTRPHRFSDCTPTTVYPVGIKQVDRVCS